MWLMCTSKSIDIRQGVAAIRVHDVIKLVSFDYY